MLATVQRLRSYIRPTKHKMPSNGQRCLIAHTIAIALVSSCGIDAHGPDPDIRSATIEQKATIERYLRAAEDTLPKVPAASQHALSNALLRARSALDSYDQLARQGSSRRQAHNALYVTGVALIADDASGVGIADNVLLPFVALGIVAVHLTQKAPAPPQELSQAWNEVIDSFAEVGQLAGTEIRQALESVPPMDHCIEHYGLCLTTPLGIRNSGGRWRHSICQDCLDICHGSGHWPARTGHGKSCDWWRYAEDLQP